MSKSNHFLNGTILLQAITASFVKLDPRVQLRNPVMFAVYVGSILTSVLWLNSFSPSASESPWFVLAIAVWLWITVLFANFAEAIAEGRSKAQADFLRSAKRDIMAKKLSELTIKNICPHFPIIYNTLKCSNFNFYGNDSTISSSSNGNSSLQAFKKNKENKEVEKY